MSPLSILGLGRVSTAFYVEALHQRYAAKHGEIATCPFHLIQADFSRINPHLPGDFDALQAPLNEAFDTLSASHPKAVLVPNITLHEALDNLGFTANWPLIHPVQLGAEQASIRKGTLSIVGTRHTAKRGYIRKHFEATGLAVVEPPQQLIDRSDALRLSIAEGSADTASIQRWALDVVAWSAEHTVVLACTELSMARSRAKLTEVIDLVELQLVEAAKLVELP